MTAWIVATTEQPATMQRSMDGVHARAPVTAAAHYSKADAHRPKSNS
ncbi:MAG: hypothetical protein IAE81_10340 [Caldilineaceae bacterium]|nr:hypothetical protein [Caldilineaceae bacterium]